MLNRVLCSIWHFFAFKDPSSSSYLCRACTSNKMQNRWCILFPLVQSYQLHWFFLPTAANLVRWWASTLHQICKRRVEKEDQRATLYVRFEFSLSGGFIHTSSSSTFGMRLKWCENWASISMYKKPTTTSSSSAMETTTTRLNMGEWFFYRQTMSVSERMISTDRITIQFPTYGNKKMHSTFPFKLHSVALKNLSLMAASRKKKRTVRYII